MAQTAQPLADAVESAQSAVSWGAVIAGALAAATITIILMLVGSGIGLAITSPWPGEGVGLTSFAVTTAIGIIVIQWLSAAVGGYLAGRLRTKWVQVHSDEIFFRDTVHGFLAWAVATLLVFGILGSGLTAAIGGSAGTAATVAAGAAAGKASAPEANAETNGPMDYLVDMLLRPDMAVSSATVDNPSSKTGMNGEISRILAQNAAADRMDPDDRAYLVRLISANTGTTEAAAAVRVDTAFSRIQEARVKAQEAADEARKTSAVFATLSALALLIGAFIASVAATLAGRQRDDEQQVAYRTAPPPVA